MNRTQLVLTFLTVVALGLVTSAATPSTALARPRGFALINTGEDIFTAGPLPAPYSEDPELKGYEAGYMCSIFGVFWVYLHTWDCKPVAFSGDTYVDAPEVVQAIQAKYTEADKQMGFWKGHMRWVLLGLIVLGGAGLLFLGRSDETNSEPADSPST